ncbi:MAG TPA: ATP-dependent DNA helicase RecG [Terriglobales bacterium]|jgi:ATP-dependent DNA helicase RecG|nr:ATP-dependent DNA helicase RecG [Terriglobales bacterium]
MPELSTPVQYVKGIGPRVAEVLAAKGINTVEDLLYYLPFRYEDRLNPRGIAELRPGEMATVIAEVRGSGLFRTRRSGLDIFQMTAGQGRAKLTCLWFHGRYLMGKFQPGQLVALYGKVEENTWGRGGLQIIQPQFEVLGEAEGEAAGRAAQSLEIGRIVPIYESAANGKLTSRWFRRIIYSVLEGLPELPESIPGSICERLQLVPRQQAFRHAHWPEAGESLASLQAARTPAHRRLIFEELFFLELGLELKRRRQRTHPGITFELNDRVREAIKHILPFHPTAAQKKVLKEIASDMRQGFPMRRLLQGDVGSGKTIVALQAAIIAIENGYQVALMAPTEILATQHYLSARRILEHAGYRIVLLTGSVEQDRKRDLRRHIARGDAQLVIGTHALIQQSVEFANLGLVIVDEQHRFGVLQRFKLMRKASESQTEAVTSYEPRCTPDGAAVRRPEPTPAAEPDTLVMTATPIPRTLALTIYGDLDVSVLDELPPGRSPIVTRRVPDERAAEVWDFVRQQVAAGHQAYVVYPVIEENEERELKAAIQMYKKLRREIMPDLRIGLLHGRLDAEEKDAVMRRFQKGEVDVLVSTTVIEVGVDVPNASLMLIEHAEMFGLAQLHQLRGRIGRGSTKSYCILMTGPKVSEEGEQRLQAMLDTTDGFKIAEMDLELRGPGEFFGTKQAGMPSLRVANIVRDRELLEVAKKEAAALLANSNLEVPKPDLARAFGHLRSHWNRRYGLVEVG